MTSVAKGTVSAVELTIALGLTVDPSIIESDGATTATVTAKILDLEGVEQIDDNSTVVTFSITEGSADLMAVEVTADNGVATTTLTSSTSGTITVQASATGAREVTATVISQSTGGELPTGPSGPIALDLDLSSGDQEQRQSSTTPNVGDVVSIDLVAVSGLWISLV